MKRKFFLGLLAIIVLLPLFMCFVWILTSNTKLVIAIVDKTVLTPKGQEHISLNWVLNHEKFTKTSEKPYQVDRDYFGFFPLKNEKYKLKGLERFSSSKLTQLSNDADMVYFTDTYGIYNNEWYTKGDVNERSGMLYGGLSNKDIQMLDLMKEKKKLIIAEFNTIGSPTNTINRARFEEMFQIKWTGWTARYFDNLDLRTSEEIPAWLIKNYKKNHANKWPFKSSGIAFVNTQGDVVILEKGTHLKLSIPHIVSSEKFQEKFSLPPRIKYPFWFDVMIPNKKENEIVSSFKLDLNDAGTKILNKFDIPISFPAVTRHSGSDYSFYYFSGDFADNPVSLTSSYFAGVGLFKGFFYDERDIMERSSFFWKFYKPLFTQILEDYSEKIRD